MKTDWKVGDTTYIYLLDHRGKLTEGKIVYVLNLDHYSYPHYVIEIETGIDPILEVRDALTMADNKNGRIGFWDKFKEESEKDSV